MTAENREEMLSAYLDGELSVEDRARVESWLAESAAYRQLLEELRGVRSAMQSLVRHTLPEDAAAAVLRRAAPASSDHARQAEANSEAVAGEITPLSLARDAWARGGWRRVVWPVLAFAAALLIAFFNTEQKPAEKQVALNAPAETGETPSMSARPAAARRDGESLNEAAAALKQKSLAERNENPGFAQEEAAESKPAMSADEASVQSDSIAKDSAGADQKERYSSSPPKNGNRAAPKPSALKPSMAPAQAMPLQTTGGGVAAAAPLEQVFVCDVTDSFVRERGLEKVLESNKVPYRQMISPESIQANEKRRYQRSATEQVEEPYLVEATPAQTEQIVNQLRAKVVDVFEVAEEDLPSDVKWSRKTNAQKPQLARSAPLPKQAGQKSSGDTIPRQIQFFLRVVEPPQKKKS